MTQPLPAILSLILLLVTAFLLVFRVQSEGGTSIRLILALVLSVVLQLVPVYILGTLQLLGVIETFSILHIGLLSCVICLGIFLIFGRASSESSVLDETSVTAGRMPRVVLLSIVLLSATYLVFLIDSLTSFPRSWDGVEHRLPLSVTWLQEGSLAIPESREWRASPPGNGEMLSMLLLGTGWQPPAALVNLGRDSPTR